MLAAVWCVLNIAAAQAGFFGIQLDGIGPTNGDAPSSNATLWLRSRTWKAWVWVGSKADVSANAIAEASSYGWVPILTAYANPYHRKTHDQLNPGKKLSNLSIALEQYAQANQTITNWEYMVEDDSSGSGFARLLIEGSSLFAVRPRARSCVVCWRVEWYLHAALPPLPCSCAAKPLHCTRCSMVLLLYSGAMKRLVDAGTGQRRFGLSLVRHWYL